ncbi:hypothetical protein L211DRAFT_839857 [Terfezia boudieri ATCC MYA-4762]|uniref:Transcription factor hoxa13 n=1 Tax=Terfezia boudieri ATCC MYA-4762 TaxID=1051890 RepID=A0A3N4LH74_9PEZI|nr:hypothetical protein L211DRAFT_839857 [Terfezia boudieri ATCC MYA-4762]
MLHRLLFSQSGPKAPESPPSSKTSEAQLRGISSRPTTQPSTPTTELHQSEALHLSVADMPSNSKGSRKKKAEKPTESTSVVSPAASLNSGGKNEGHSNQRHNPPSLVPWPPKSNWFSLSKVWRILLWFTLYTVLFQCPTVPDPSSSTICHVYSKSRDVANPYYENYVSPYIDKVAPHISHYNEAYYYPALEVASTYYEKYIQPIVQRAQVFVEKEYQEKLHPIVGQAYSGLNQLHLQHLAPYTSEAYKLYHQAVSSPYWGKLRHRSGRIYNIYLVPTYKKASPYLDRVYENGRYVTIVVLGPYVKEGARVSGKWLEENVWHGVSDLWRDYVEVQVGRIKDRVNSGNENSSSFLSSDSDHTSAQEEIPERKAAREAARKQIEEDLDFYSDKFEKYANEAIESLNAKVDQITAAAMKEQKPIIEEQMKKLDKTISNEMRGLKATIMNLAKHYKPGNTKEETESKRLETFDKSFVAIYNAGKLIKDTVQDIRWESQRFLAAIFDEVAAEADTRIEKLDSLIDSGIQELGMKWAWEVDGVTYKDWARYQDLKKEFSGIKTKIVQAAEKNKRLNEITNWVEGGAWEGGANTRAKEVAGELARIKRIAKKKIELNDYSEDFSDNFLNRESKEAKEESTKAVPEETPALKKATGIVMAEAQGVLGDQHAMVGDEEAWKDTLTEKLKDAVEEFKDNAIDTIDHVSKAVSEAIYGTKTEQPVGESITSVASDLYNSAWTAASSALYGTPEPGYMGIATDKYSAAVASASRVIYGTPTPATESIASVISEKVQDFADKVHSKIVSEEVYGNPHPLAESMASLAGEAVESVKAYAKEKVEAGENVVQGEAETAASVVKEIAEAVSSNVASMMTQPPAVEYILNAVNHRLQEMVEVASEKIYGPEKGAFEKATSAVSGAYDSVASKASESVYGRETGAFEAAASVISEVSKSASAEISIAIYGPPKSPFEKVTSVITENLDAATSVIEENVEAATNIVGENLGAAKAAVSEALYGREEEKYYASIVESAEARLHSAVESASMKLREIYEEGRKAGGEKLEEMMGGVKEAVEEVGKGVGDAASRAAEKVKEKYEGVKDEL